MLRVSKKDNNKENNNELYELEPTMDFVFKRIFGQDDTKDSLLCYANFS